MFLVPSWIISLLLLYIFTVGKLQSLSWISMVEDFVQFSGFEFALRFSKVKLEKRNLFRSKKMTRIDMDRIWRQFSFIFGMKNSDGFS